MTEIAYAIENLDFDSFNKLAIFISKNAGCICAFRLQLAASTIEYAFARNNFYGMIKAYPSLVEAFVEFKRHRIEILGEEGSDSPTQRTSST
jgi:hypothetical protein